MSRLDQQLSRLAEAMSQWQPALTWQTVRLASAADARYSRQTVQISQRALLSPEAYADQFEKRLRGGYSWINLHAARVVDGVLIVIVELPDRPSGATCDCVAINLSGPTTGVAVEISDNSRGAPAK
jgi:hypothetical protein